MATSARVRGLVRWPCAALVVLALGACSSTVVRTPVPTRPAAPRIAPPPPGATTVVRRGDTLYSIATRNGVSVLDVASWNALAPPYTIYPGQRLRLSPTGAGASTSAPGRPSRGSALPSARPPANATRPPVRRSPPPPAPPVPTTSGFAWRWPAEGALLSRFVAGEPTRQGIGIAGTAGVPVRAAADGTVVYSGAGLVGYGELVIVKHDEKWLSAYGHNRRRLVNEGQLVKAGQQIAEMGRSGAPREMLHFEIRFNGRPVDPLLYLPPR